jgi:uncharacterized protein (TIGR02147 family)
MSKNNVYGFDNYRNFLTAEINKIKSIRKNFSIRAMAKHLDIGSTTLIEVLSGKKNLSLDLGYKISEKLKLSHEEALYFLQLVMLDLAKEEKTKKFLSARIKAEKKVHLKRHKISENQNHILTLNNAIILSLASTFPEITTGQVATLLKISTEDTHSYLERLVQIKLLKKIDSHRFQSESAENYLIEDKNKNAALIKYHTECLHRTIESLHKDQANERAIGSEVLSFSQDKMTAASEIINSCLDKLVELSNSIPLEKVDSVYLAGCQLTRLGRIRK